MHLTCPKTGMSDSRVFFRPLYCFVEKAKPSGLLIFLTLFVLWAGGAELFADVIKLKNDEKIEGRITEENDDSIIIEIETGSLVVPTLDIVSIEKKPFEGKKGKEPFFKRGILAKMLAIGLFFIIGYFLYALLVYMIFWGVTKAHAFLPAILFSTMSVAFFYFSKLFILPQAYFSLVNIILVRLVYRCGWIRSALFGFSLALVVIISSSVFFIEIF